MENKHIGETKTPEEILEDASLMSSVDTGKHMYKSWVISDKPVINFVMESMRKYADQEKRATAIGFRRWHSGRIKYNYRMGTDMWLENEEPVTETDDQLYDLYLQSQPHKQ
jgi:hypothetical protein